MVVRRALKATLLAGGLALAGGAALHSGKAEARVFVGFGFGVPLYAPYYYPPPVVYAPPPVVYTPPPVGYAQPPVSYAAPPQQSWYYCADPQGYYPTVQYCSTGWQQVPASPPAAQ